jgi:methyl-accepting chemotaxis protein
MSPEIRTYRRKQYFIARKFQTKYAGLFLVFMFLTGALCSYIIYYTIMVLLGEKLANVYPQGRLIAIINAVNLRILLGLLTITPLVVIISIFLSHKIAGPMYRMEKFMTTMATGDFTQHITLRKGDELKTLAERINFFVDSLRTMIGSQKSQLAILQKDMENIKNCAQAKHTDKAEIVKDAERMAKDLQGLTIEMEKFKI